MKRLTMLVTEVVPMAALLMALSGAALAQTRGGGDVCLSQGGQTIYDSGPSDCGADPDSQAVTVNHSYAEVDSDSQAVAVNGSGIFAARSSQAVAVNHSGAVPLFDSQAVAVNHSFAGAAVDSEAVAVNHSDAFASHSCSATALNGEEEDCGTGGFPID